MGVDTFPKLLLQGYKKYGDRKAIMRQKDFGIWQKYTWKDFYQQVKYLSLGLVSLGLKKGDAVTIIGDNEPEWILADIAVGAAGGAITGAYPDSVIGELKYIIEHSDSKFVIVQDQEQVDKLLELKKDLPKVEKVIYWDPKELRNYDDPMLLSFEQLARLGREVEAKRPGLFEENIDQGKGNDPYMIAYTSGTTGVPKGAILTHFNVLKMAESNQGLLPYGEDDVLFSAAPLAWSSDHAITISRGMMQGTTINFPESPDTAQADFRLLGPTSAFMPPRMWEGMHRTVQVKIADAGLLKRGTYLLFLPVGYKMADFKALRRKPPLFWRLLFKVGHLVVFRPLQDKLGLLKLKHAFTGGAMLGSDVFRYFSAIGVNLKQIYGITEAGGQTLIHANDDIKYETVGVPHADIEARLSDTGELLFRCEGLFAGYHKNPQATAKAIERGWLHTGDYVQIDTDGHIVCIDRMGDVMTLKNGTRFAPQYVENKLKFGSYVKDAVVFGDKRDFIAALIDIDFQTVGKWAEEQRIAYTTYTDLSQRPEVYALIQGEVEKANKALPPNSRVSRFANLYKELDPDEAELTRTRKIRRGFITERYKELVEALFGDRAEYKVETEVKYRDGRVGNIKTTVKIVSLAGS